MLRLERETEQDRQRGDEFPVEPVHLSATRRAAGDGSVARSHDACPSNGCWRRSTRRPRWCRYRTCCFRSSFIQDLAAITKRAHEVGAKVVADLYQSAGTVPVNVRELGVDFATGGSVKWLCGGPGAGYLYVRRDLWPELKPRMTGWAAHREPVCVFAAEHEYADGVARFLNGTPNVPAMYAARSGYEIINEIGVENIRAKSMRQTARLIELAKKRDSR